MHFSVITTEVNYLFNVQSMVIIQKQKGLSMVLFAAHITYSDISKQYIKMWTSTQTRTLNYLRFYDKM